MNQICSCYKQEKHYGYCTGTKKQEECFCRGNRLYCDFYPGVRIDAEKELEKATSSVSMEIPCKVGSKIYRILNTGLNEWQIGEGIITEIRQRTGHNLEIIEERLTPEGCCSYYPIPVEAFGKTVFCDPKEAERELLRLNSTETLADIVNKVLDEDNAIESDSAPATKDNPEDVDRLKDCIAELYILLGKLVDAGKKYDFSMLRPKRSAGPCDMYQGLPPICRVLADIDDKYYDIISEAVKEFQNK